MKILVVSVLWALTSWQLVASVDTGECYDTSRFYVFPEKVHFTLDNEDLALNFNQIRQLITSFSNANLVKAVNFALESTERSKS